jgi:hypothetical protein
MFKIEHNAETGEIKEIELSAAEVKKLEKEYADAKIKANTAQAEAKAKETQRQAILDRIGLTADELKTILG